MPYDHSGKIGNEGDVVKHAVLTALPQQRLQDRKASPFVYAESHTGRPEYVLPEGGSWTHGIQEFAVRVGQRRDSDIDESIRAYRDLFLGTTVRIGYRYPGSSGIALRLVHECRTEFRFILYEIDAGAWADLRRFFRPWDDACDIEREDGVAGIARLSNASLVFVDPPDLRNPQLVSLVDGLPKRGIPFMCWTPRISGCFEGRWEEGGPSKEFYRATRDLACFRIRWRKCWRGQGMKGCQITVFPAGLGGLAEKTVRAVCEVMEWQEE